MPVRLLFRFPNLIPEKLTGFEPKPHEIEEEKNWMQTVNSEAFRQGVKRLFLASNPSLDFPNEATDFLKTVKISVVQFLATRLIQRFDSFCIVCITYFK